MATLNSLVNHCSAKYNPVTGYIENIEEIRLREYPSSNTTTYLDHAGTTLYPTSLIEAFSDELAQNIFGNPHSASASSQLSTRKIDDVRLQVLRFFNASPDHFDVVFTANATAAIKLVGEIFRDLEGGFRYCYHLDSHTSLIGVRELAVAGSHCFDDDEELEELLLGNSSGGPPNTGASTLMAYPGQSNMTGYRYSLRWARRANGLRADRRLPLYTLFDAAALAASSPLDLSEIQEAPDFICVSFYKIFGFPDLGALLVRKDCATLVRQRRYFGGGTVDAVLANGDNWHAKRETSLHSQLEDGTLPFHNIIALGLALRIHARIYESMARTAHHTWYVTESCVRQLKMLRHANGGDVCRLYDRTDRTDGDFGPVIALNILDSKGKPVSVTEFEKLTIVKNIQLRTGGLCSPGGTARHLQLSTAEIRDHHARGYRCGGEDDVVNSKPIGSIRVSFGAMSSLKDVDAFLDFVREFYVEKPCAGTDALSHPAVNPNFIIESLFVFPIKSCAAYKIPPESSWEVGREGLMWDRQWCLVHEGTKVALSQKRYSRMALLRPSIDLRQKVLRVTHEIHGSGVQQLVLNLEAEPIHPTTTTACEATVSRSSSVCGDTVDVEYYISPEVSRFFTDALGVPCTLARFSHSATRHVQVRRPASSIDGRTVGRERSIALSNESPILLISRSSVNRLNEEIKTRSGVGKAVSAASFRGNLIVSEELESGQPESPYAEDGWIEIAIGDGPGSHFEALGPCQRCQMVCVDQENACRKQEPFSTLSKTRRRDGRVWFGMHLCLVHDQGVGQVKKYIKVGDRVTATR